MPHLTRRAILGSAAFAGSVSMARAESAAVVSADWSSVVGIAESATAAGTTPGLQISVRRGEEVLFSQGFGLSNIETQTPVAPTSVFRIGSITKEFTAALVLSLAEGGYVSPDDRLGRFFPGFPRPDVSLEQLITHTSGLSNYTNVVPAETYLEQSRLDRTTEEMVSVVAAATPLQLFASGSGWAYSNSGYVLLGAVIEQVTGSYADALAHLVGPLGLSATAVDDASDVVPARASGYVARPDIADRFANAPFASMSYAGASGAMRSTADDLGRWRSALLDGRVVREPTLRKLITPVRLGAGDLPTSSSGEPILYGGGVYLDPIAGAPALRGGGTIQGFAATCDTLIESRQTLTILMNVDPNSASGLSTLRRDLRRAINAVIDAAA
ncbi:serine hydrolase domain-containing protein [Brevundimonas sp.]|uniref:serine hydrolase domain-containing protein n=1 Tax=Brevundimonas sp. TaxID=1871086 RepID=UPI002D24AFC6|nr:serine hydrolase domain-containing protein [Brevundimonas sp.]HYC75198.1 serine hydrolase domain-containing protein [Brevundimonas sp.]